MAVKLTHEEFLNELQKKDSNYKSELYKVVSEYDGIHSSIYI